MNSLNANGFVRLTGLAVPYLRHDVLIDYIAPPGAGIHVHGQAAVVPHEHARASGPETSDRPVRHAFQLDRFLPDGTENPGFVLNREPYRNASILLAGRNFGIGGTQTSAAASLLGCGFRAVIAPSFGPVFHDDCVQAGLLPIVLAQELLQTIAAAATAAPRLALTIDLEQQHISRPDIGPIPLRMNPRLRDRFMRGLSDVDETIPFQDEADAFRKAHELRQPWIYQPTGDPR